MLSGKQAQICRFGDSEYDALICDGAIRFGKTSIMMVAFVEWAMQHFDGKVFGICGKTVGSARRNIVQPFTRPEHGAADGQVVAVDEPFTVGGEKLMSPGDKTHGASGWNLYNCRCTTVAVLPGIKSTRQTYSEWMAEKKAEEKVTKAQDTAGLKKALTVV